MTTEEDYDKLLYPILCNEGNIIGFFDKIFNFLYRRTDYFKIKTDPSCNIGLAVGEAEDIIKSVFCKYMKQAVSQHRSENISAMFQDCVVEEVVSELDQTEVVVSELDQTEDVVVSSESGPSEHSQASAATGSDKQDEELDPKIPWMDSECYNGARYEDYSWAQSMKDIDVRIKVANHVTTGKQVKVCIKQSSLNVEVLSDGKWDILKNGDLAWKINVEESTWTLVPGEHIHLCLQKLQERWWDSFFVNEPKIDLKSIDPSMPFEDLDEEAQAKINELMYNEHQKRLGRPTIQQNKITNILKEAWNSEGSPFKGQPFDPSMLDIQNADAL